MAAEILVTDGSLVMVRWIDVTIEGLARVDAAVKAASAIGPVTYVGLVGNSSAMPSDDVRKRLTAGLEAMAEHCKSVSLVLDGTGLKFSAMRSAAAAVFLIKGTRQMKMYASLDECLRERLPERRESALAKAKSLGLID
jgi:hypothetical protein